MPRGIYKRKGSKVLAKAERKAKPKVVKRMIHSTNNRIAPGLPSDNADAPQRDVLRDWINSAPNLEERQKRKVATLGIMYGGSAQSLCNWPKVAEEDKAAGFGFGAAPEKAEDTQIPYDANIKPGPWVLKEKFNPDEMFVKPPLYDNPISPAHYQRHPSGVECITITEHFNFNRGNAIKYIWRADEKGSTLENLRKAQWYLNREIDRLEKEALGQ